MTVFSFIIGLLLYLKKILVALGFTIYIFWPITVYLQIILCHFTYSVRNLQEYISSSFLPSFVLWFSYILLLHMVSTPEYSVTLFALDSYLLSNMIKMRNIYIYFLPLFIFTILLLFISLRWPKFLSVIIIILLLPEGLPLILLVMGMC